MQMRNKLNDMENESNSVYSTLNDKLTDMNFIQQAIRLSENNTAGDDITIAEMSHNLTEAYNSSDPLAMHHEEEAEYEDIAHSAEFCGFEGGEPCVCDGEVWYGRADSGSFQ